MAWSRLFSRPRLLPRRSRGIAWASLVACGLLSLAPLPSARAQDATPQPAPAVDPVDPAAGQPQPTDQRVLLARYLDALGVKYYGAWWCPHCHHQEELFGAEAKAELPYVECEKPEEQPEATAACRAAGVRSYPTWIYRTEVRVGVQSLGELAEWTNFFGRSATAEPAAPPEATPASP